MDDQTKKQHTPGLMPGVSITAPNGEQRDMADEHHLRHGRDQHLGFKVGKYLQPPPFFFTRDKWPEPLVDKYRGASAFLINSGPSFATLDHSKLRQPGILTMGLNNSVKSFRPHLWTCVDNPQNFLKSTWDDPAIHKIVPISHIDKPLWDSYDGRWQATDYKVADCPNVTYYKRNERFKADQYLFEDTINWGNHTNMGGGRSVMLAAIRILFLLGIRRVFLLGADFNMKAGEKNYHFEQARSNSSVKGNNSTYKMLQERFTLLRPIFEDNGYHVFNCNSASQLTAFEHMPFDEAIELARNRVPADLSKEKSEGLYDRLANEKKENKQPRVATHKPVDGNVRLPGKTCEKCNRKSVEQVKAQVNAARTSLHDAKDRTAEMMQFQRDGDPKFNSDLLTHLVRDEGQKRLAFRRLVAIRDEMLGVK